MRKRKKRARRVIDGITLGWVVFLAKLGYLTATVYYPLLSLGVALLALGFFLLKPSLRRLLVIALLLGAFVFLGYFLAANADWIKTLIQYLASVVGA